MDGGSIVPLTYASTKSGQAQRVSPHECDAGFSSESAPSSAGPAIERKVAPAHVTPGESGEYWPMRDHLAVDPCLTRAGFTISGRLATPIPAFRGLNVDSLALLLAPLLRRASTARLLDTAACLATRVTGISHGEHLTVQKVSLGKAGGFRLSVRSIVSLLGRVLCGSRLESH